MKHYIVTSQSGRKVTEFDAANPRAAREHATKVLKTRKKSAAADLSSDDWYWHSGQRAWIVLVADQFYYIEKSASVVAPVKKETTVKKRVVKVKKSAAPRIEFAVGVPVNVKVVGERVMLKRVTLLPTPEGDAVKVLTGRRGRPSILPLANIERVRAL